ncbi:HAMP domain-containing histidine kinase [Paenibacillus sp. CC-CFT747]|nr:HAMP domain-containing histidine kinase [Paenibacillus sp. CC-CFT747]
MNSLFRKWLTVYLALLLVTIVGLSATIGFFLERDVYRESRKTLEAQALAVEDLFLQWSQGSLTIVEFTKGLKTMEKTTDVRTSIMGKRLNFMKGDLLSIGEQPAVGRWVKQVMEGSRISRTAPFQDNAGENMMILGFPLQRGGETVAAAFVYRPVSSMTSLVNRINRILLLVSLGMAVPAALVLFYVSRRFVGPIIAMRGAAARIAEGEFSKRVQPAGKDELGDLARSFNEMAEKLERVEAGRRRFLSEISHELRTPLTTVRASLQGLEDGILTPAEEKEFTGIALKETRRMSQLIDDLLQLSSFEESRVELNRKPVCLARLVEETAVQMRKTYQEGGIELVVERNGAGQGTAISADEDRLRQVLLNLLDNAAKHNPAGTRVAVGLEEGPQSCRITVRDNGPGIPREAVGRLFERLYKADASRHTPGAGLGLTIARHIVELHGGRIGVESEPGRGTAFTVLLPVTPVTPVK